MNKFFFKNLIPFFNPFCEYDLVLYIVSYSEKAELNLSVAGCLFLWIEFYSLGMEKGDKYRK